MTSPRLRTEVAVSAVAAFALAVTACGTSSLTPTAKPATLESTRLLPVPAGTVTLAFDQAARRVTANLDVYGFGLNSAHAFSLVAGSCSATGALLAAFPDIAVNTYGAFAGPLTSTAKLSSIPASSHVEILLAGRAQASTAPGSTRIACADLNSAATNTSPLMLNGPTSDPASGTVTLTYEKASGSVVVHIVATGLPPSSKHAVHIHFGSCHQQSGVLYALGDVTVNAAGSVDDTVTLSGVRTPPPAGAWYADVHVGATDQLETSGQATMFLQPILCGAK